MMKTWDDIKIFDDIILANSKKIITNLEKELQDGSRHKCPHLRKEGNFFYYCGLNTPEEVDKKPTPFNPIYQNNVSVAVLQIDCLGSYKECCSYKKKK